MRVDKADPLLALPRDPSLCSLTLIPTSGRQTTWRAFIYHSKPEDMILGNLLLLVLSFFTAFVFAEDSDYDGTRIANRTIERVRLLFSFLCKTCLDLVMTYTTRRLFDCRRTHYLLRTSTKTFKTGASRVLAIMAAKARSDAPLLFAGGGTLVPMRMWYVTGLPPP